GVAAAAVLSAERALACIPDVATVALPGDAGVAAAVTELRAAVAAIPDDPQLAVDVELAAYQSWPLALRAHPEARQPIELPNERLLRERLSTWRRARTGIVAAVAEQTGEAFSGDTVDQLERAASLLPVACQVAADGAVVVG